MKVRLSNLPVQSYKINCIKLVRYVSNKGLKDSKDFVESLGGVNGVTCDLEVKEREAYGDSTFYQPATPAPTIEEIKQYVISCGFPCFVGVQQVSEVVDAPAKKGQNQHTKALAKEQDAHAVTIQTLAEVSAERTKYYNRCNDLEAANLLAAAHASAQALRIEEWRKANRQLSDALLHAQNMHGEAVAELNVYKLREATTGVTFKTGPEAIQVFANFKARDVQTFHRIMTALDALTR